MAGSISSEEGDIGFQIAPMVDVVFVLMLFFMASAGMQVSEKELGINLPSGVSTSKSAVPLPPIVISIASDGAVQINSDAYDPPDSRDLPLTREHLHDLMSSFGTKNPVIIQPAPDVRHERIINVLNACAAAGVKNLSFS
jgi:biopolymer transport protein ExbD